LTLLSQPPFGGWVASCSDGFLLEKVKESFTLFSVDDHIHLSSIIY
jgi:hypothetical protein